MTAKILNGNAIAEQERLYIAQLVKKRVELGKRRPGLAVVLVGQDPASRLYVQNKRRACEAVGIYSESYDFSATISVETLLEKIDELNHSPVIDGILVQLPLPKHIPAEKILESISVHKDVDGFHSSNMGKIVQNQPGLRPCTPMGIISLLSYTNIALKGCNACVVGASRIVGRPMALELLNLEATVTMCHRYTQDLPQHIQRADLVVVAIGQPRFIQGDWIKEDAIVIDVGTTHMPDGKIVGDVDFETAKLRASWITPVPGGVGPMTVTWLLKNTLIAAEQSL
ncbi:MAG: bifunctional methylenetetrahydrofolate dehydrogenase/methenyltetrahydrofolate cyclohydrolase FolD [Candidatus Berkiellales bacterium]